jgi:hypothetical protein
MAGNNLESGDGGNQNRDISVEANSQLNSIELLSTAPPVTNATDANSANTQHAADSATQNNANSNELIFDNSIYNDNSNTSQNGGKDSSSGGKDSAPVNNSAKGGKDAPKMNMNIPGNLEPSITPGSQMNLNKPFADSIREQMNSVVPRQLEQRAPSGGQAAAIQSTQRSQGARQER